MDHFLSSSFRDNPGCLIRLENESRSRAHALRAEELASTIIRQEPLPDGTKRP